MKQIYKLLALVAFIVAFVPCAHASEWSYDWPVNASADKANGYAGGFYNFGTTLDPDITSIERTLNGMAWKLSFDKGTKLTYLASSGLFLAVVVGFQWQNQKSVGDHPHQGGRRDAHGECQRQGIQMR